MRTQEREPSGVVVEAINMKFLTDDIADKIKAKYPQYKNVSIHYDLGLVRTPKGYFMLNTEGVMNEDVVTEKTPYEIDVYCSETEDGISILPSFTFKLTDVMIDGECEIIGNRVPLEDFIRRFGSRLESNYSILRKELRKQLNLKK